MKDRLDRVDQKTLNKFYVLMGDFAEDYRERPWPDLYDLYDDRVKDAISTERTKAAIEELEGLKSDMPLGKDRRAGQRLLWRDDTLHEYIDLRIANLESKD